MFKIVDAKVSLTKHIPLLFYEAQLTNSTAFD